MNFADLCSPDDVQRPWYGSPLNWQQKNWERDGVIYLQNIVPPELISAYRTIRDPLGPLGWSHPTPYFEHPEVRDLCLFPELMQVLDSLIEDPLGLHLNLTKYVSTERHWHQDTYLNPENVKDRYAAVWIALEDIHPDSGPFQYVAGSHTWPRMSREALFSVAPKELLDPHLWPTLTQDLVGQACRQEIVRREGKVTTYLPRKGDCLIWHPRLMHRGSVPNVPGTPRHSLIAHYSAINVRPDMPTALPHSAGHYFPIDTRKTGATT